MSAVVAVRTTKVVPLPLLPHRTHLLSRDMEVQKEVHMILMLPCTLMGKWNTPNQSTSTPKVNSLTGTTQVCIRLPFCRQEWLRT